MAGGWWISIAWDLLSHSLFSRLIPRWGLGARGVRCYYTPSAPPGLEKAAQSFCLDLMIVDCMLRFTEVDGR